MKFPEPVYMWDLIKRQLGDWKSSCTILSESAIGHALAACDEIQFKVCPPNEMRVTPENEISMEWRTPNGTMTMTFNAFGSKTAHTEKDGEAKTTISG